MYNSDIKKMLNWFQLLNGKVDFTKPVEADAAAVKKEDDKPAVPKVHEAHGPKGGAARQDLHSPNPEKV